MHGDETFENIGDRCCSLDIANGKRPRPQIRVVQISLPLIIQGETRNGSDKSGNDAGTCIVTGFIAPIASLALYYEWQGNLHDAYLWAWAFAVRYVEAETTVSYVLKRFVTVHLAMMLCWGLLWYFGIWQVIETFRSLRQNRSVCSENV